MPGFMSVLSTEQFLVKFVELGFIDSGEVPCSYTTDPWIRERVYHPVASCYRAEDTSRRPCSWAEMAKVLDGALSVKTGMFSADSSSVCRVCSDRLIAALKYEVAPQQMVTVFDEFAYRVGLTHAVAAREAVVLAAASTRLFLGYRSWAFDAPWAVLGLRKGIFAEVEKQLSAPEVYPLTAKVLTEVREKVLTHRLRWPAVCAEANVSRVHQFGEPAGQLLWVHIGSLPMSRLGRRDAEESSFWAAVGQSDSPMYQAHDGSWVMLVDSTLFQAYRAFNGLRKGRLDPLVQAPDASGFDAADVLLALKLAGTQAHDPNVFTTHVRAVSASRV